MIDYRVGDIRERLAEIPDGSIDLIVTSPPFLRQRTYLPDDHPDKAKEVGLEDTPAAFIDTLLELTATWRRVLAPHGSLCVELGDKFASKGGTNDRRVRTDTAKDLVARPTRGWGEGWPLDKSLCGVPHLYQLGLIWGRNLLTGTESPAGQWRVRNYLVWGRPNPSPGSDGDKFRPAASFITIAALAANRYFDVDAVRTPLTEPGAVKTHSTAAHNPDHGWTANSDRIEQNPAGAPPLDWHADEHPRKATGCGACRLSRTRARTTPRSRWPCRNV